MVSTVRLILLNSFRQALPSGKEVLFLSSISEYFSLPYSFLYRFPWEYRGIRGSYYHIHYSSLTFSVIILLSVLQATRNLENILGNFPSAATISRPPQKLYKET
jgi:hypothetical protein